MTALAVVTLTLDDAIPVGKTITIDYATQNGTAIAGTDYTTTTGTLTMSGPDDFGRFTVPIVPPEGPDKSFTVVFSNLQTPEDVTINIDEDALTQAVTIPGSIAPDNDDTFLNRADGMFAKLFDLKNRYFPSFSVDQGAGYQNRYEAPYYLSANDSKIIMEDRLPTNSVDNGLQQMSETMAFVQGALAWHNLIHQRDDVQNNFQNDNLVYFNPEYSMALPKFPGVDDGISEHLVEDVSYRLYESGALPDNPPTPEDGENSDYPVQLYPFTDWPFAMIPNNVYYNYDLSATQKHGFVDSKPILQDGVVTGAVNVNHVFTGASNNVLCSETRGRYESVWQTLIPHYQTEGAADVKFGNPIQQHYQLFQTEVPGLIDSGDPTTRRMKWRNNPFADMSFIHWDAMYLQRQGDDQGNDGFGSIVQGAEYVNNYSFYLNDGYFRGVDGSRWTNSTSEFTPFQGLVSMSFEVENFNFQKSTDADPISATYRGSSDFHHFNQNPAASEAISGAIGSQYYSVSPDTQIGFSVALNTQLVLLRWLQSVDGPIAGGVTSSWEGNYGTPTDGRENATFNGLYYTYAPGKVNPPSNDRVEYQLLGRLGLSDWLYDHARHGGTQDPAWVMGTSIMDPLIGWLLANITVLDTSFSIPTKLKWTSNTPVEGETATTPNTEGTYEYLPNRTITSQDLLDLPGDIDNSFWEAGTIANEHIRCSIVESGADAGLAAAAAYLLIMHYAAYTEQHLDNFRSGGWTPENARTKAKQLLDVLANYFMDDTGLFQDEVRADYLKYGDQIPLPITSEFGGETIYGLYMGGSPPPLVIEAREWLKSDPKWSEIQAYINSNGNGTPPSFRYHRTWVQCMYAMACSAYYYFVDGPLNNEV